MPSTLPFFAQETRTSCVPACVRMVMATWGIEIDEATLRVCCQTDWSGTAAKAVVACVGRWGLKATEVRVATLDDLRSWLDNGIFPIVYLNLFPLDALWVQHAVVVEVVTDEVIVYLDPAQGKRTAHSLAFDQAWQMQKRRAIIISSLIG